MSQGYEFKSIALMYFKTSIFIISKIYIKVKNNNLFLHFIKTGTVIMIIQNKLIVVLYKNDKNNKFLIHFNIIIYKYLNQKNL